MKWVIGAILIGIGFYFFMGDPTTDTWPTRLGPWAVDAYQKVVAFRPYSSILFCAFGVTAWLIGGKDYS